ncbi:hypothetical protein H2198_005102 [Neophaeococcomyces mojaviensis]|uniref:Uncharacterized protein n=1 Tax=Neophaeococcomyces mojaviensis TaxID=3383035 RepID=A0ACC3A777_9EURO|nr:hypothetical protein H2198_005102 [Knufia sp. JES_112]
MRLLRQTGQNKFSLTPDLCNDEIPSYAILSHTWGADRDEVTFVDVQQGRGQNKAGYAKIQFCARQAKKDGIEHFWVDTCCINKDNHVELSEAITSMFQWYRKAKKCYVYLPDVSTRTSDGHGDTLSGWESNFRASRWFTRGWTLQELLAPTVVEFYSREEGFLGTKITLARQIHEITTIPLAALQGTPLSQFPIAERIRWTERRNTKKKEDEAYCLLGIFDVFMPLIYGEGDNALHRLQKEINGRFGADVTASLNASYKTRSLGLCLNSAPLIKPDDFVGRTTEINNVHNVLRPDQEPVEQRRAILGGIGGIGAYLRRSVITFQQYLDDYEQRWQVESRRPLQLQDYRDRTLYTTWNLSYNRLKEDDAEAAQMLQLLAYFDNQDVWFELLHAGMPDHPLSWLRGCLNELISFESVMSTLVDYCFVEVQYTTQSYSMHNCVHDWVLGELNAEVDSQLYWYAFDCVAASIDRDDWDLLELVKYARVSRHGVRLTHYRFEVCDKSDGGLFERLDAAEWTANMLNKQAQLLAAEQMYLRALAGKEKAFGSDHTSTLATVHNLGTLYRDQGKLNEAEQMLLRALAGTEKALGPDHTSTLATVHSLGTLYCDQGKLNEAEQMYLRALAGKEKALGPDHTSTLATVHGLGILYRDQGKLDEAEQMYLRALAGTEKALGPDHTSTLDTINNLGLLYRDQGKLNEAEQMFLRALDGYEKAYGREHQKPLKVRDILALIHKKIADQNTPKKQRSSRNWYRHVFRKLRDK